MAFPTLQDSGHAVHNETGLVDLLGVGSRLLSGYDPDFTVRWSVERFQEATFHRQMLETPQMPVLRIHVHRAFDLRGALLLRVYYARSYVDYLGSGVQ